jgi:hypothetical protein
MHKQAPADVSVISVLAIAYYPFHYVTFYTNLLTLLAVYSATQPDVSEFADEEAAARHAEAHPLARGEPGESESERLGFCCLTQE